MTRRLRVIAAALLATLLFAGCTADPGVDDATGSALQAGVVSVAGIAAAGDPAAALMELDALEQDLTAAVAAGRVSSDRNARITAAIALVRTDLQSMLAADEVPAEETPVAPVEDDDESGNGNNGNGNGNGGNNGNGNGGKKDD